jgi:FtsH-binding integral membrane protein
MSEEDEILDLRKKPNQGLNVYLVYGIALLLFIYWFLSDYLYWPFGQPALLLGMILLFIAAFIRLRRSEEKRFTAYAYFLGRVILIVGVFLHVIGYPQAEYLLWTSFIFFGAGLSGLYFGKKN